MLRHLHIISATALLALLAIAVLAPTPMQPLLLAATQEKPAPGAVLLIVDGLGSQYLSMTGVTPSTMDGETLAISSTPFLSSLARRTPHTTLKVPVPETTPAHAVLYAGGRCFVSRKHAQDCFLSQRPDSACDAVHSAGWHCVMISHTGDFAAARGEFDVVLFESKGNFEVVRNSTTPESRELERFLKEKASSMNLFFLPEGNVAKQTARNKALLDIDSEFVAWWQERFPKQRLLLVSTVGGVDTCGHKGNSAAYTQCIEALDTLLSPLVSASEKAGYVFALTADHGMAFHCAKCRGGHASYPYNLAPETRHVPFLLLVPGQTLLLEPGSQEDVLPTLLQASGIFEPCRSLHFCTGRNLALSPERS